MKRAEMLSILCKDIIGEDLSKIEEQLVNQTNKEESTMTTKADAILNTLGEEGDVGKPADQTAAASPAVTGVDPKTSVSKDLAAAISKAGKQMDSFIGQGDKEGEAAMKKGMAAMKQAQLAMGQKVDGLPSDKTS